MQHCTDLPSQVTFLVHTKPGKMGPCRVGINVTAHQNKEKSEEMRKGKKGAGEKRKRKQAADFREAVCCPSAVVQGQHSEKIKGSAWGDWDPRKGQQPFRPNPNGVGDRTTTVDWCSLQ